MDSIKVKVTWVLQTPQEINKGICVSSTSDSLKTHRVAVMRLRLNAFAPIRISEHMPRLSFLLTPILNRR
jgi:hypothetical protein